MPPTTSLLFRTLAILEGTLSTLCPGYPHLIRRGLRR